MPLTDDVVVRRKDNRRAVALEERLVTIEKVAGRMFATRGYNGTSLRDVAAGVGLSPAGLLHYFPDKAALLEAVLDARLGTVAAEFGLETGDGETFVRGLVAVAERDAAQPEDLRLFCLLSAEALDPAHPAHGYFIRWFSQVRAHLQAAFEDLDRRGLYRGWPIPPAQAAVNVSALRDGLNLQWLLSPDQVDFVATIRGSFRPYVDLDL